MFRKILLLASGTKESMKAADICIELALAHDSQIIAIYVVDTNAVRQLSRGSSKSPGEIAVEMEESGWRYLYHIEDMAKNKKAKIVVMMENGSPPEKTLELARQNNVDLIVLSQPESERGPYGRSLDKRIQQIFQHSPCPVLIAK